MPTNYLHVICIIYIPKRRRGKSIAVRDTEDLARIFSRYFKGFLHLGKSILVYMKQREGKWMGMGGSGGKGYKVTSIRIFKNVCVSTPLYKKEVKDMGIGGDSFLLQNR